MRPGRGLPPLSLLVVLLAGCNASGLGADIPRCDPVPDDGPSNSIILQAQSVPTAELVPCVDHLEPGWEFRDLEAERGRAGFSLGSDRVGSPFLKVTLAAYCSPGGAEQTTSDEEGTRLFRDVEGFVPLEGTEVGRYQGAWYYRFAGGCVTYRFSAEGPELGTLPDDVAEALSFFPREELRRLAREQLGLEID